MCQVVVDAATRANLVSASGRVEVRDEAGELLGDFIPKAHAKPLVPWEPSITQDELDRRVREPGRSWSEIRQRFAP